MKINKELEKSFENFPTFAFKRPRNLKNLIGGNTLINNKVKRNNTPFKVEKCKPCYSRKNSLCCKQVIKTSEFTSQITKENFQIYHELNCKSKLLIYLMECVICKKQYIGKSETSFNIRLNNHRSDVSDTKAIPACRHFTNAGHDFNEHAKFILIECINKTDKDKETVQSILKKRENFWIKKLKTLKPNGFNQELNQE